MLIGFVPCRRRRRRCGFGTNMSGHMTARRLDFGLGQFRETSRSRQQDVFHPLLLLLQWHCRTTRIAAAATGWRLFPIGQDPGKPMAIGRVFKHHGILVGRQENHVRHAGSMMANQDMSLSHQGNLVGKTQCFQGHQGDIGYSWNVVLQLMDQVGQIGQVATIVGRV